MRFGVCSSCSQYNFIEQDGACPACAETTEECSGTIVAHLCDECGDTLSVDCDEHDGTSTTILCLNTGEPTEECTCDDGDFSTIAEATAAIEDLRDAL